MPLALHLAMAALLAWAGIAASAGWTYYAGVAAAVGLVVYERRLLVQAQNVFALNERVFLANMAFSIVFLATTAAGYLTDAGGRA